MASLQHLPLLTLLSIAKAFPLQNITLLLPPGTSNHGTPGLLCTPTKWIDVALFFLFNYVAHAATVLTLPGERSADFFVSVIGSLLFPALGLYRGIDAILSGAVFVQKDDLRKAARSGALCMVVRDADWRPVGGEEVKNVVLKRGKHFDQEEMVVERKGSRIFVETREKSKAERLAEQHPSIHIVTYSPPWMDSKFGSPVYVHRQIIHGIYHLPQGYRFAIVPSNTQFVAPANPNTIIEVSSTYNIVKALTALIQSGYALSTLYRARGDQIEQFGYAAFGLTVAPYAVMSIVNLIGNLCRPDYASLYMVENSIMDEARNRGAVFTGSVARVQEDDASVCGCGLVDGHDAEHLRFSSESGDIMAHFDTTTLSDVDLTPHTTSSSEVEKPHSAHQPQSLHTHLINPLPVKLDWTSTKDDALLFLPRCNPIVRTSSSPTTSTTTPFHHRMTSLALRKACPPFKTKIWIPKFTSPVSLATSLSTLNLTPTHYHTLKHLLTLLISLIPLFTTGILSGFHSGSLPRRETSTWRAYTMQWLAFGIFSGITWVFDQERKDASPSAKMQVGPILRTAMYVCSGASAVGGYIVVGQMLGRYGSCMWLGD